MQLEQDRIDREHRLRLEQECNDQLKRDEEKRVQALMLEAQRNKILEDEMECKRKLLEAEHEAETLRVKLQTEREDQEERQCEEDLKMMSSMKPVEAEIPISTIAGDDMHEEKSVPEVVTLNGLSSLRPTTLFITPVGSPDDTIPENKVYHYE